MGYFAFGAGIVYIAIGIASLVISIQYGAPNGVPVCGANGHPPLPQWLFGTGVAYIIIGACCSVFGLLMILSVVAAILVFIVLLCGSSFIFAWMIVGAVSLWRDGSDCGNIYPVWAMGMAAVITTIIVVASSMCGSRETVNNNN